MLRLYTKNQEDTTIENHHTIEYFVQHEQQGEYITLPFTMPPDTESFHLSYHYERHHINRSQTGAEHFTSRQEGNIIDLGLIAPDGAQVGASGSDKSEITISETQATPGYKPRPLVAGEWCILLGAYKVAPGGVLVRYTLSFTPKRLRLLKGDLHTHTLASDGVLTAEELARLALGNGLDFLAITDHNQMSTSETLPRIPGLTLIPGVEWTHFKGHALFLGVDRPYDEPFFSNDLAGVKSRFDSARQRGATITINHPFEEACPFLFDMAALPFDCLEIWNGPMRESNLRALGLWQQMLVSGKKVPLCGGSDYHREHIFIPLGGPTMCVYALSPGPSDILEAIKQGHAYLTYAPDGPSLVMHAVNGDASPKTAPGAPMMGDSVPYPGYNELHIQVGGLLKGDLVQAVTKEDRTTLLQAEAPGELELNYRMENAGFARVEVWRGFLPGLPLLPALISNPVYFE
jgi:hypothetical protein